MGEPLPARTDRVCGSRETGDCEGADFPRSMSATELHPFPFPRQGEAPSEQKEEHMFVFLVSILGSLRNRVKVMGGWDTVSQADTDYVISNWPALSDPDRQLPGQTYSLRIFATIE